MGAATASYGQKRSIALAHFWEGQRDHRREAHSKPESSRPANQIGLERVVGARPLLEHSPRGILCSLRYIESMTRSKLFLSQRD